MAGSFAFDINLDDADGLAVAASMLQAGATTAEARRVLATPAVSPTPYTAPGVADNAPATLVGEEPVDVPGVTKAWAGEDYPEDYAEWRQTTAGPEEYAEAAKAAEAPTTSAAELSPAGPGAHDGAATAPQLLAAAVAAPPTQTGAVVTDADGQPWDVRIHVGSRAKVAAGTWRLKPKVDPALVDQVRAENTALMALPVPDATPAAQVAPPVVNPPSAAGGVPAGYVMPTPPVSVPDFYRAASQLHKDNVLSDVAITAVAAAHGVPSLQAITQRPDLIPTIWAAIVDKAGQQ